MKRKGRASSPVPEHLAVYRPEVWAPVATAADEDGQGGRPAAVHGVEHWARALEAAGVPSETVDEMRAGAMIDQMMADMERRSGPPIPAADVHRYLDEGAHLNGWEWQELRRREDAEDDG